LPLKDKKRPGLKPKAFDNHKYVYRLVKFLKSATYLKALHLYRHLLSDANLDNFVISKIAEYDRFFFLTHILNRADAFDPWLYDRCREVEKDPDGHLDLWAREHYKSTIITFAGVIQELIKDRELTVGIFSHTRPIAKAFLAQIKMEMEINEKLPLLWPHIFWSNPRKEAPVWSLDSGIIVKRERNPKEASIEAWGLVDGQPASKHFELMVYDDVVTADNCTPQMIPKTTKAWELSQSLSARNAQDEKEARRFWYIGTRYHFGDTYGVIIEREAVKPRLYPATDTGTPDGDPVFLPVEDWEKKKRDLSPSTLACQYLQNPLAGEERIFKLEWLRYYEVRPETLNVAILVDPADSKSASACNSAFAVIGLDKARNKYLLDGACHKMGLKERWEMLKKLRKKWLRAPGVRLVLVGYEKYGMQADIQYFEERMDLEKYHFPIQQLNWPREGGHSKDERIERLVPDHQTWQFFYPYDTKKQGVTKRQKQHIYRGKAYLVSNPIMCIDHEKKVYNLVDWFITNEYSFYPTSIYKDFLDAMSRTYDLKNFKPPTVYHEEDLLPEEVEDY
jgi:hypothetical protein